MLFVRKCIPNGIFSTYFEFRAKQELYRMLKQLSTSAIYACGVFIQLPKLMYIHQTPNGWISNVNQRDFITKCRSFQSICPVDVDGCWWTVEVPGEDMILSMQIGHWNLYHFEYDYLIRLSKQQQQQHICECLNVRKDHLIPFMCHRHVLNQKCPYLQAIWPFVTENFAKSNFKL